MSFYKATNPEGKDFRTGTIDYANAVGTGVPVDHPDSGKMVPNSPSTYLSVSVEKAETLIGGAYPCRLFEVEPVGDILEGLDASKHKRACKSLLVIRELPAWEALGPNGRRVDALIKRAKSIDAREARELRAAGDAARDAAGDAAWYAARYAARDAAGDAAWCAAWAAAGAELVRGLITPEQYNILAGPWNSVIGEQL